ncbi:MAG: hypothetical protein ACOVNL_08325 [Prochlorococcaceae cyanobacterium]|jgi:hypothetical protein
MAGHTAAGAIALVTLLAAMGWARGGENPLPLTSGVRIGVAHGALVARGWLPRPDRTPDSFERRLSGTDLPSLSSCSQSGMGFCRYDYGRAGKHLVVITTPSDPHRESEGVVQQWWIE